MFGFDKVATFTHEFETAFDRVRKGEIKPTQDLISVALAAKDYHPRADRRRRTRPMRSSATPSSAICSRFVPPEARAATATPAQTLAAVCAGRKPAVGWHLRLEFDQHILRNGSNPLDLLDDLAQARPLLRRCR